MALFGFLKDRQLKPTWTFKAEGTIWRVVPDESGKIVGEVRNVAEKATSFFCLNQMTGEVFWERVSFGERWWIGIEAIHKGVLLLHGFSTPDLPEHKGIIAVDLMTGKSLWNNVNLTFVAANENSILASQQSVEDKTLFELDYRTGVTLGLLEEAASMFDKGELASTLKAENEIELPAPVTHLPDPAMSKHYNTDNLVGNVESVDHNNLLIFNFHEKLTGNSKQQALLKNTLKVLDKPTGNILYAAVLNAESSTVIPESFFIQNETLFFVREKCELTALHLPGSYDEN